MHRELLFSKLNQYQSFDVHERSMQERILEFIKENINCFERSLLIGHITASALIINKQKTHTLMTHHQKLGKWLQLGGHSDGDPDTLNVALREALEESGLKAIEPISEDIFDVDVHEIPARKNEPAHFHYDIRFLFEADDAEKLIITNESNDLRWIPLDRMEEYTTEESVMRMVRKILHR
ncbi:MAG TPA: NUDIX hydrolase [Bacteroidetes bacterium]|nr:NUDIX hydrolase [Bacteroidota bacterium]